MSLAITASIVVFKNDAAYLKNAVDSFLSAVPGGLLFLIDNSPCDEISQLFPSDRVRYHRNKKNIGFGSAHNIAIKKAIAMGSKYHIVLNPDVYFSPDVIPTLHRYMEGNEDVGLVMPKVLYPDGSLQPLCKLLPSPFTLLIRRFVPFSQWWRERINHSYEMRFSGYNRIMDVPFLSGCFMFLRVSSLQKVGLFDESIFLYTEDADLSRRIHKHYRTMFFPDAVIYHHHERASYKNMILLMYHVASAVRYFNKWGWFSDNERRHINERVLLKLSD